MSFAWLMRKLRGEDKEPTANKQLNTDVVDHKIRPVSDEHVMDERPRQVLEHRKSLRDVGNLAKVHDSRTSRLVLHGSQAVAVDNKVNRQGANTNTATTNTNIVGRSASKSVISGSPGCSSVSGLSTGRMYVALYDYDARTDEDLSFRKNEHLEVVEFSTTDWWMAKSHVTGLEGYIPATYVAQLKSIEAEAWYFGKIQRVDAEHRLMFNENDHGAFLIRDSETRKNEFSMSVRDDDKVRHYRIRPRDHGGFFINRKQPFSSLHDLVTFYRKETGGLCTRLNIPCMREEKPDTVGLSYNTWDTWEIRKSELELGKRLGAGHFGEVYAGFWNKSVAVAIKTLKAGKMHADDFLAEAQLLKKLRHPKLLQLYGVCTLEEPFYIVTELMQHGSLLDHLRGNGRDMGFGELVYIGGQVASGMEYLENENYIHRDLAARNVLVGKNNVVKVADFGLSRLVKEEEYQAHEGAKFPIKWTAPEALNYSRFTTKSDVWSFGVLLMEIITHGATPYPGMSNVEVAAQIEKGYRMPQPLRGCPDRMYNMMLTTWAKDPINRPTFYTLRWQLEDYFTIGDSDYKDADQVL